jgi:hypothetical protein
MRMDITPHFALIYAVCAQRLMISVFIYLENDWTYQSNVYILPLIKPFVKGKSKKINSSPGVFCFPV